jgi:hypothetical protein
VLGDYNVAPEDRDVHDPEAWKDSVLVSEPERERFRNLLALGLKDSFRLFEQPEKSFSWWDYRRWASAVTIRASTTSYLGTPGERLHHSTIDRDMRKLERPSIMRGSGGWLDDRAAGVDLRNQVSQSRYSKPNSDGGFRQRPSRRALGMSVDVPKAAYSEFPPASRR